MQPTDCEQKAEWASGNIYIRRVRLAKAGDVLHGHTHNFDHTTIVFTGAVHVHATCEAGCNKKQDFAAPSHFLVRKDWRHEITALVDGTEFWCVYSHRDPQGNVVQEYTGWSDAHDARA